MIIIEKSLFKFSRSIENFISTPVSFFFSFPRIFIHVYETNECHFFFLFPRFSINSRKVLLKYSARNSSEEGGEEVRNFFFLSGNKREMGMSLEKVESSDRGIFVKFARSLLRDGKTQIPSGSIPCIGVFRAIFRAWQRWRFHKRVEEITETQRGKNITNFLSQTTHFNFIYFPSCSPYYISSRTCRQTCRYFREINHTSPLVLSIPLFSPRLLLFHLIIHLRYCCIAA